MKKILLIFFILFATEGYSQTISYGLSAGLNYTNLAGSINQSSTLSNDNMIGFRVGGLMDIRFKAFSIQPGILFTTMGGQIPDHKVSLDYIEMPVNLLFRAKAGHGSFFIGGGPYVSIGVAGKYSYTEHINGTYSYSENLVFGSNYTEIENPDFGLNLLMGVQLKSGLAISAGYGFGLINTYHNGADNKNRGFNISVDYFF